MREINPKELTGNTFKTIGTDWLLITAEKEGKINTMTASWGGLGVLWNKNVAYIFIRPQRYTKEFVDSAEKLSLSVLPNAYRDQLNYFGKVSGRDEDKIAKSGLKVAKEYGVPYFSEADTAFICKKLYAAELAPESFIDKDLIDKCYPEQDFHTLYVVEIEKVLVR